MQQKQCSRCPPGAGGQGGVGAGEGVPEAPLPVHQPQAAHQGDRPDLPCFVAPGRGMARMPGPCVIHSAGLAVGALTLRSLRRMCKLEYMCACSTANDQKRRQHLERQLPACVLAGTPMPQNITAGLIDMGDTAGVRRQ